MFAMNLERALEYLSITAVGSPNPLRLRSERLEAFNDPIIR